MITRRGFFGVLMAALVVPKVKLPFRRPLTVGEAHGYTTPRTWVTGDLMTATQLNKMVRDSLTLDAFHRHPLASYATDHHHTDMLREDS